jgi:hypothetical protein
MAAFEARIFQTIEEANEQIRDAFLEAVAQELHTQGGLRASIFHPLHLVEPEKPFITRLIEDNQDKRFSAWLSFSSKKVFLGFNMVLSQKRHFPKGIESSDFEDFMRLRNKSDIIDYIIKNGTRNFIATYAVTEDLLSTTHSKKARAIECIESFCKLFGLDAKTFENYSELSRLSATKLTLVASPSSHVEDSLITAPKLEESAALTADKLEKFEACKKVIQPIREKESDKASIDLAIDKFCKDNNIDYRYLLEHATKPSQSILDAEGPSIEEETSSELGPLQRATKLVRRSLELDAEIQKIENYDIIIKAIYAMKTLQSIEKYESMITELSEKFSLDDVQTRRITTICGYGLTKPYIPMLTSEQYEEFRMRKENFFSQIRHEVYYRVAEKGITTFKFESSIPLLMQIKLRMECIVMVIELAFYNIGIFDDKKKIVYDFNKQSPEKDIPPFLYDYYTKLKELIQAADSAENTDDYLTKLNDEIMLLQMQLAGHSIHNKWHSKFLKDLSEIANLALDKSKESESLPKNDPPSPSESSYSSSSSSFHSENRRRSNDFNASSSSAAANDSRSGFRHSGSE